MAAYHCKLAEKKAVKVGAASVLPLINFNRYLFQEFLRPRSARQPHGTRGADSRLQAVQNAFQVAGFFLGAELGL